MMMMRDILLTLLFTCCCSLVSIGRPMLADVIGAPDCPCSVQISDGKWVDLTVARLSVVNTAGPFAVQHRCGATGCNQLLDTSEVLGTRGYGVSRVGNLTRIAVCFTLGVTTTPLSRVILRVGSVTEPGQKRDLPAVGVTGETLCAEDQVEQWGLSPTTDVSVSSFGVEVNFYGQNSDMDVNNFTLVVESDSTLSPTAAPTSSSPTMVPTVAPPTPAPTFIVKLDTSEPVNGQQSITGSVQISNVTFLSSGFVQATGTAFVEGSLTIQLASDEAIPAAPLLLVGAASVSGQFESISATSDQFSAPGECRRLVAEPQYSAGQVSVVLSVDTSECSGGLGVGAIVGIAVGAAVVAAGALVTTIVCCHRRKRDRFTRDMNDELKAKELAEVKRQHRKK